ncbi:MAG: pilus assembly protein PilM [Dehalococcoidales bacterium]|nr:MAG: pilus assembly protein PilM [Dehalococcoidales bacterium]
MFSKKIVTLNIESTDIRLLTVVGKRVQEWSTASLDSDLVKEGLIIDPPAVSAAISRLMADQGIKEKDIITSLSGFQSVQRTLDLPKLSHQLIGDALLREAKRTMPVSLDQLYLSWQILHDGDQTQPVFLLGIPRNLMDAQVVCLQQAGISPRTMELKPLALARMVNRPEALIVDVEEENADIIVISGGIPIIMRTLSMRIDQSLSRRLQYLVEEFERTLQFYASNHPDEPLGRSTPLFLTGGLAKDVEVVQVITAGIEYKIEPLESPFESPPDFPSEQYAVNIGMALKYTSLMRDTSIPDVNILPDNYRPHRMPAKQMLLVPGIVAGIAVILPLYQLANSANVEVYQAQAEYNKVTQQLQIRQLENKRVQEIEAAIAKIEEKKQQLETKIEELGAGRLDIYDTLSTVAVECLPSGATLFSTSYSGGQLKLQGNATSYTQALEYSRILEQTEKFAVVWINSLNAADDGTVNFSITLTQS